MNILPIMNARCEYPTNLNKRCNKPEFQNPSFGAELSDAQVTRVLNMLKGKVTDIQVLNNVTGLKNIADSLMQKYQLYGLKSVGAMLIPEEHLSEFVDKSLYPNLNEYKGICIAVGNKYGPIESWTKTYQAILALIPKSKLSGAQYRAN